MLCRSNKSKTKPIFTAAKQRTVFGSTTCNSLSRFLGEIPENLVEGIEKEKQIITKVLNIILNIRKPPK